MMGPLAEITGQETVIEVIKGFSSALLGLSIRATFESDDQAVVILDLEFPQPIGSLPGASLLTIQNNLITKIELFYDGQPFTSMKKEIFAD